MSHQQSAVTASGHRLLAEGMRVTRIGLGMMQLPGPGVWGPPADRSNARAVLRAARDLGVNHIDTSDAYGPHVANDLIREALFPYPPELVVATKVGAVRDESRAFVAGDTPGQLREQVEENLRRLGMNELDLVYLRVAGDGLLQPGPTPFVESFGALIELRQKGLIRHLGLSGVSVAQFDEARGLAPVVAVQNRYHLLDRGSVEVLVACEQHDIAFVPYFPLSAGLLDPDLDTAQMPPGMGLTTEQARTLDAIAQRHGASRPQVAIAWLLHQATVTLAIPGTSQLAHLEQNVDAAHIQLSADDMSALTSLA